MVTNSVLKVALQTFADLYVKQYGGNSNSLYEHLINMLYTNDLAYKFLTTYNTRQYYWMYVNGNRHSLDLYDFLTGQQVWKGTSYDTGYKWFENSAAERGVEFSTTDGWHDKTIQIWSEKRTTPILWEEKKTATGTKILAKTLDFPKPKDVTPPSYDPKNPLPTPNNVNTTTPNIFGLDNTTLLIIGGLLAFTLLRK